MSSPSQLSGPASYLGPTFAPEDSQRFAIFHERETKSRSEKNNSDGYTLYRALARQVIGDPDRYGDIQEQVLHFAIRAHSNPHHPLHHEYARQAAAFDQTSTHPIFAALDCPDLDPTSHVMWVVAYALKIRLKLFEQISQDGQLGSCVSSVGPDGFPLHFIIKIDSKKGMAARFCALLPDESGKALIEYLQNEVIASKTKQHLPASRNPALSVKQISWAWGKSTSDHSGSIDSVTCFNGHRSESKLSDLALQDPLSRLDTFAATVNDPLQVRPALDLLKEALKRAPNQCRNVRAGEACQGRIMRPQVAADCEFIKTPRERAEQCAKNQFYYDWVRSGNLEELCSVLTLAVGRHFFLMFNIVHMLENATEHTVPALESLFREVVFNPELIKLWWNPQCDFAVLNSTIAHMYQGTPRPSYNTCMREEEYNEEDRQIWVETPITVTPQWRIESPHLCGTRPADLIEYLKITDCELHEKDNWDYTYCGCPCAFGNIDIAALFNHFCRQHGLPSPKHDWSGVRYRFKYDDLLTTMLGTDKLSYLLHWMKSIGGRDTFYQRLGKPGMEKDDYAMAYNIGDVAGQNLIFEQLLASDDKGFIGGVLNAYHKGTDLGRGRYRRPTPVTPARSSPQRIIGACGDLPLILDNPRSFKSEPFGSVPFNPLVDWRPRKGRDGLAEDFATAGLQAVTMPGQRSPDRSAGLAMWEHNEHVAAMRFLEGQPRPPPAFLLLYEPPMSLTGISGIVSAFELPAQQQAVRHRTFDPTKLWMLETMVYDAHEPYANPIVRSNTTHAEALITFLGSTQASQSHAPPGFGATPGSQQGLPGSLSRVPGGILPNAKAIFAAFQAGLNGEERVLPEGGATPSALDKALKPVPIDESAILEAALGDSDDIWDAGHNARSKAKHRVASEKNMNEHHGLPYLVDTTDVFDPDGREYRRRAEAAEEWNRPQLTEYYQKGPNGEWRSLATVTLESLESKLREDETRVEGQWAVAGKKKGRRPQQTSLANHRPDEW